MNPIKHSTHVTIAALAGLLLAQAAHAQSDNSEKVFQNALKYTAQIKAAVPLRPDWVIEAASKQAQRIMEAGKSDRYFYAITWLTYVRNAYKAAGRADAWRAHVQSIRAQHGRKYKLMGMIDQLR